MIDHRYRIGAWLCPSIQTFLAVISSLSAKILDRKQLQVNKYVTYQSAAIRTYIKPVFDHAALRPIMLISFTRCSFFPVRTVLLYPAWNFDHERGLPIGLVAVK